MMARGRDRGGIYVGMLPGRKKPVLWEENPPGVIRPLAYFTDAEAMARFMAWKPSYSREPPPPPERYQQAEPG